MLGNMELLAAIKRALKETPFKPFNIVLDNGSVIQVKHPDCMILSPDVCMVLDGQGTPWTVDTWHVSGINFERPRPGARKAK